MAGRLPLGITECIYSRVNDSESPPNIAKGAPPKGCFHMEYNIITTIEEVEDEAPPNEQVIQEIPFIYV